MKTAIITGASGQLGPIWTDVLSGLGFKAIYDFDLPHYNLNNTEDIERFYMRAPYGPDAIILNAAIDNPPGSQSTFHGNLDEIINVNLVGHCKLIEKFLPDMIKFGGGVIVGITSIQGFVGADWRNYEKYFEKPVGYNLSKAALNQYMRSLTVQYGRYGIRACAIGFGAYDGGKLKKEFLDKYLKNVPLGCPVSKESAKAALKFALTCPEFAGQVLMVDGGYLSF